MTVPGMTWMTVKGRVSDDAREERWDMHWALAAQ